MWLVSVIIVGVSIAVSAFFVVPALYLFANRSIGGGLIFLVMGVLTFAYSYASLTAVTMN